jgi:hypothetical protein
MFSDIVLMIFLHRLYYITKLYSPTTLRLIKASSMIRTLNNSPTHKRAGLPPRISELLNLNLGIRPNTGTPTYKDPTISWVLQASGVNKLPLL